MNQGSTSRRPSEKRVPLNAVPTVAVYDFALRCAIRACLEQTGHSRTEPKKDWAERHSVHLGVSDMLSNITEKFSDDSRTDRLTREIVRGLLRRLDDIRKGRDTSKPEYQDQRFLSVVTQIKGELQGYRFRPSGTVNDLVILFTKTSELALRRSSHIPAAVYEELNRYTSRFVELVILTVQEDAPSSATPELMEKLRGFLGPTKSARSNSDRRLSARPSSPSLAPSYGSFEYLEVFPMVKTVQRLFQVTDAEHSRKLRELHAICTESALLIDMKKYISNVHTGQSFPGKREDFPDKQVFDNWQMREIKQLTELMKSMMLLNPTLAISANSETDVGSSNLLSSLRNNAYSGSEVSMMKNEISQGAYTFIPADPRAYFRLLMNMAIDYNINVTPDQEKAKTSVLSHKSDELLRECWKTWRLSEAFRAVLYLELINARYVDNELEFEDVKDAARSLEKVIKESGVNNWANKDRENLIRVFDGLNQTLLHALMEALSEYWKVSPEWVGDLVSTLDRVYDNPAYIQGHRRPLLAIDSLTEIVEGAAVVRWRSIGKTEEGSYDDGGITVLIALAEKLVKEFVSLTQKRFKTPIKGVLSVPSVVMGRQMPFFALEMENWAYLPEARNATTEVIFKLYHKVLGLKRLYDQHGPRQKRSLFKVESWFLQHVRRWLETTNDSTPKWVESAIDHDEFVQVSETISHSSSIVDLFTMFHEAVDFLQKLQWPNELQRCRFLTVLSKVIGHALDRYTSILEEKIIEDIYPTLGHEENASATAAFFSKARLQLTGNRHSRKNDSVPPDFTPQLCVKINDIEAARTKLDKLYQIIDVDEISYYMRENDIPAADVPEQTSFMYSIKVVRAENLQPLDNNGLSDPYAIMEINGKQISRTRTVYETLNPRWDQVFDIWLTEKTVDVVAIVYDEDMIGADEECGGVWFKLSPEYYDDYQQHDIVLNLLPQGRLVLRVSMEGEKDDIQFWFSKAFRTLRRVENDSASLIVDKMGRFMRACLSRKTLDKLLQRDRSFFRFSRTVKSIDPTLQDCEDAIAPLLDYLEKNLKILNDNLSEGNMRHVILKIWKEILLALEGVLLPPLSEHPSEMKPLDDYEFHCVYKWLELLKVLFNGGEDADAVQLETLENAQYYSLLAINVAYNLETEELIEIYNTALNNQMELKLQGGAKADRSKSVYHSRHTAKHQKVDKKAASIDMPSSETVLRILRMRSGKRVRDFLRSEFDKRNNPPQPPGPNPNVTATKDEEEAKTTLVPPIIPDRMVTL
ncbi:hypothetical protein CLU79DRAFT_803967 [Phycomyces nitens]|nr:hypothetical protein CLU79DRAFT_803967 [Phycomyces nitens]